MLGHENSNVRRSCAAALPEGLDSHPAHLASLLAALKELYRVKVSNCDQIIQLCEMINHCSQAEILGPEYDAYVSRAALVAPQFLFKVYIAGNAC